jgi:hypothetical protein
MPSGPPNSSACAISSRVTAASRPFSKASPSSRRQATIIGRGPETQTRQTRREWLPSPLPSMA